MPFEGITPIAQQGNVRERVHVRKMDSLRVSALQAGSQANQAYDQETA